MTASDADTPGPALLRAVESSLGMRVRSAARAPWGFRNDTWMLDAGEEALVLQVFDGRDDAERRVIGARALLGLRGVAVPEVLVAELDASRPWTISRRLAGAAGYEVAGPDLSSDDWPSMASSMGSVVRALRELPTAGTGLPTLWSTPGLLADTARGWLDSVGMHLSCSGRDEVARLLVDAPGILEPLQRVVCHGDFGPQNVLFAGAAVRGLVDLEDVRVGPALLDVAWWNWLVRAHTPRAFDRSWASFLGAADVDDHADGFDDRIHLLTVLRLLETAEHFRRARPENHASWGRRIEQQLTDHARSRGTDPQAGQP